MAKIVLAETILRGTTIKYLDNCSLIVFIVSVRISLLDLKLI